MSNIINTNKPIKQYGKVSFIVLFLLIFAGPPFVIELFPGMSGWKMLYIIIYPLFFLYAVTKGISLSNSKFKNIIVMWIFAWVMYSIIHHDSVYISRCMVVMITFTVLSYIYSIGVERFCKYYIYLMLIFSILGTIAFLFFYFYHIPIIFEYENADGRTGVFLGLTCSNVYSETHRMFRYSGFFDEPGAMGLWGLLAILLNKLIFNNRKIEIILIVCLLFTFSIAYFISISLYLLLFVFKPKNIKIIIPFSIIIIGCLYFISKDSHLNDQLFGRLQYDKTTGTIEGNTRAEEQKNAEKVFKANPLFGVGATNAVVMGKNGNSINSNILSPFAKDGIVGVFVLYAPFLLTVWKQRGNNVAFKCLLVYSLSFFHRSIIVGVFDITMYLIFLDIVSRSGKNYLSTP